MTHGEDEVTMVERAQSSASDVWERLHAERHERLRSGAPRQSLTVRCDVSVDALRADLFEPETCILYRGAAVQGAGGLIHETKSVDEGRRKIILGFLLRARGGVRALVYLRHRADGDETLMLNAGSVQVRSVYLPGMVVPE